MQIVITHKKHDKKGHDIWIVRPVAKLSKAEWTNFKGRGNRRGGRYSNFVEGVVFKFDPSDKFPDDEITMIDETIGEKGDNIDSDNLAIKGDFTPQEGWRDHLSRALQYLIHLYSLKEVTAMKQAGDLDDKDLDSVVAAIDKRVGGGDPEKKPFPHDWEEILRQLIPPAQFAVKSDDLPYNHDRLIALLKQIPPIYGTRDTKPGEIVAWLHYFGGHVDLYVTEFTPPNDLYVIGTFVDGGEFEGAYWYLDQGIIGQLPALINLDYYWEPKQMQEIDDPRNRYYDKPEDPSSQQTRQMQEVISADYKNQFEVNRVIEKLLDDMGEDFNAWTPEAAAFLSRYSGYGGLGEFLDPEKDFDLIKGTLFEYYTPDPIIKKMWGLAYKYGFQDSGFVLEPSCGVGRFLKYAPIKSQVKAYEINKYSSRIASVLYPQAQVITDYFESEFYMGHGKRQLNRDYSGGFDLVIGNAPFGDYQGKYAGMGEKKYSGAGQVDHHFLVRGLDALRPGGLLIMIVSSRFMGGGHKAVKALIESKGELIDGYRLPTGIFQNTQVTADVLIFRKWSEEKEVQVPAEKENQIEPVVFDPDNVLKYRIERKYAAFYATEILEHIQNGDAVWFAEQIARDNLSPDDFEDFMRFGLSEGIIPADKYEDLLNGVEQAGIDIEEGKPPSIEEDDIDLTPGYMKEGKGTIVARLVRVYAYKLFEQQAEELKKDYRDRSGGKEMPDQEFERITRGDYEKNVKMFEQLAEKIEQKDTAWLREHLHRGNKLSKAFFGDYTSIVLPSTNKGAFAILDKRQYGYSPERALDKWGLEYKIAD